MLTLIKKPVRSQLEIPIRNTDDLLIMQGEVFTTLISSLRRLEPSRHRQFMVISLSIILDVNVSELPLVSLAELLFGCVDGQTDAHKLLGLQNIMIYAALRLEGGDNIV